MIRPVGPPARALPWERPPGSAGAAPVAWAAIWTTGPDPASDRALRLCALRPGPLGAERFERYLAAPDAAGEAAGARAARELGVTAADLAGGAEPAEATAAFLAFLEGHAVVVPDRAAFEAWCAVLAGTGEVPLELHALSSAAALFFPGRLASEGERLAASLTAREELRRRPRAVEPEDLRDAMAELVGRLHALDPAVLSLAAHAAVLSYEALLEEDARAAEELAFAVALAEHPGAWAFGAGLFAGGGGLSDGRLSAAHAACADVHQALAAVRPAWGRTAKEEGRAEPLPNALEEPRTLDESDRRLVDEILEEHLPRSFAEGGGPPPYRLGQHAVAAEIARTFGQRGLLLVHAPTGTGKTLAYLVPVALWAVRHGVRVGIATYTRALQEQALGREVPILRALLKRAGVTAEPRIALLKGRENYLCWRAVKLQAPERRDAAHDRLAWATLALFALTDPDGDLDRLPRAPPLALAEPEGYRRALGRLLSEVRARAGCCPHREDREDCGGYASRRRAERSHVVVTNHAFALARREFFRLLVFDECEHLHAQAHHAFSHAVPFRSLRDLLTSLYKPGGPSRAPLNRVHGVTMPETDAARCLERCVAAQDAALLALDELQRAVHRFKLWREDESGAREERDLHSLFREYAEGAESRDLLGGHAALYQALTDLCVALSELATHLDELPARGVGRLRRTLDVLRGDLDELVAGVGAWIPRGEDGAPRFRPETFYDLETTQRGFDVMAARVLLPHEHLGRHYFPDLAGAVLISATTWLRGGFEASSRYLGCQRAAHPAEGEEREPAPLATFRAPDAFDYGRVLVAAPRDAPAPNAGKRAALEYAARFVCYLGERTRGRILALFTNAEDCALAARLAEPFFAERRIPFWHQRMEGTAKEELSERFRAQVDSVLFGLDTFWYGADFPGETLEYLVIARLPYGVPDRYHHAQAAVLGPEEQRRAIYMPRALAKFRQGFGRLMRKETDRGAVFLLDPRVLDPRHRAFLRELPVSLGEPGREDEEGGATFVRGDADRCLHEAFAHMGMLADVRRRGLDQPFAGWRLDAAARGAGPRRREISEGELPY